MHKNFSNLQESKLQSLSNVDFTTGKTSPPRNAKKEVPSLKVLQVKSSVIIACLV